MNASASHDEIARSGPPGPSPSLPPPVLHPGGFREIEYWEGDDGDGGAEGAGRFAKGLALTRASDDGDDRETDRTARRAYVDTGKPPVIDGIGRSKSKTRVFSLIVWDSLRHRWTRTSPNTLVTVKTSSWRSVDARNEIAALQLLGDRCPNVLGCLDALEEPGVARGGKKVPGKGKKVAGGAVHLVTPYGQEDGWLSSADGLPSRRLNEADARYRFKALLLALSHLQSKGLCHGRIKADRIVLVSDTTVALTGFERSRLVPYAPAPDGDAAAVGTASSGTLRRLLVQDGWPSAGEGEPYAPPELCFRGREGFPPADGFAIDLWGCAVALYGMLTGRVPGVGFDGGPTLARASRQSAPEVMRSLLDDLASPEARNLLHKMLRPDPAERMTLSEVLGHIWVTDPEALEPLAGLDPCGDMWMTITEPLEGLEFLDEMFDSTAMPAAAEGHKKAGQLCACGKDVAACGACGRGWAQQAPANVSVTMEEDGDEDLRKGRFFPVDEAAGALALAEEAALPPGKRRHKSASAILKEDEEEELAEDEPMRSLSLEAPLEEATRVSSDGMVGARTINEQKEEETEDEPMHGLSLEPPPLGEPTRDSSNGMVGSLVDSFEPLRVSGERAAFFGVGEADEIVQALGLPPEEGNEDDRKPSASVKIKSEISAPHGMVVGLPSHPLPAPVPFGQQAVAVQPFNGNPRAAPPLSPPAGQMPRQPVVASPKNGNANTEALLPPAAPPPSAYAHQAAATKPFPGASPQCVMALSPPGGARGPKGPMALPPPSGARGPKKFPPPPPLGARGPMGTPTASSRPPPQARRAPPKHRTSPELEAAKKELEEAQRRYEALEAQHSAGDGAPVAQPPTAVPLPTEAPGPVQAAAAQATPPSNGAPAVVTASLPQPNGTGSAAQLNGGIRKEDIHDHDVISGRGGFSNHHPGNDFFRIAVRNLQQEFINTKKFEKRTLAIRVVQLVRGRDPPGKFLSKGKDNLWREVGDKKAADKALQAFREGAPELREELGVLGEGTGVKKKGASGGGAGKGPKAATLAEPGHSTDGKNGSWSEKAQQHETTTNATNEEPGGGLQ